MPSCIERPQAHARRHSLVALFCVKRYTICPLARVEQGPAYREHPNGRRTHAHAHAHAGWGQRVSFDHTQCEGELKRCKTACGSRRNTQAAPLPEGCAHFFSVAGQTVSFTQPIKPGFQTMRNACVCVCVCVWIGRLLSRCLGIIPRMNP